MLESTQVLAQDTPRALKARYGRELLRVVPKPAHAAALRHAFAARLVREAGEEIVLGSDGDFAEGFLAEWGGRIRAVSVEVPSLESVFMSLTGRDLRERGATEHAQTHAFGRRGGEHTR